MKTTYKFFCTKKAIPWMLGGNNYHPQPSISDGFFGFTEIIGKQFNFIDQFTASIIVDDDTYTYWKVEKYKDNVLSRTYYFYTDTVNSFNKNSYGITLALDVYMTYTRHVIPSLESPKITRGTIYPSMLNNDSPWVNVAVKALRNVDDVVLGGDDTYSEVVQFPLLCSENGKKPQKYPIQPSSFSCKLIDSRPFDNKWLNGLVEWRGKTARFYKRVGGITTTLFSTSKTDVDWNNPVVTKFNLDYFNSFSIKEISYLDNKDNWEEINKNIIHGYFAVFRHPDGYIAAFPLIGNVVATCTGYSVSPEFPGGSSPAVNVFVDYDQAPFKQTFENSWEAIREEYIKQSSIFGANSFMGIFKWVFPAGVNSKLTFECHYDSNGRFVKLKLGGDREGEQRYVPKFSKLYYRMDYVDAIRFNLLNGRTELPFELPASGNDTTFNQTLIDKYIDLLQPIMIGTKAIIPARYVILGKIENDKFKYTIDFTTGILSGFKLFCASTLYSDASLSFDFGGTLPTINESYYRTLEVIEQQKNAGVASSVGNIIATPLNWLSGALSGGLTSQSNSLFNVSATNSEGRSRHVVPWFGQTYSPVNYNPLGPWHTWGNSQTVTNTEAQSGVSSKFSTSQLGLSVGGLGSFITNPISIVNAVKQANVMKRNVGPGYMASTDDDFYNATYTNSFIKEAYDSGTLLPPLSHGIYSSAIQKIFDIPTRKKYEFFYHHFGFPLNDFVSQTYINDLLNYLNVKDNRIIYLEVDRDWCVTNLNKLVEYNDNAIRSAIIAQLTTGVRMRKY